MAKNVFFFGMLAFFVSVMSCNLTSAQEIGSSRLAKVLVGRNQMLRLQALAPLQNDVAAKIAALDDLTYALRTHAEQITEGRELEQSTVELVRVLASIDRDDARQVLIEMLDCDEPAVAMICAEILGRHKVFDAIDSLKGQVERPEWKNHYGFRFNLIHSLAQMEHPDTYEFMRLIERRIDGQLRHELNTIFDKVTVEDFGGDQERFDRWKSEPAKPKTEVKLQRVSYTDPKNRIKLARAHYYGIDIHAKRSLFIIDHSGSMNAPMYGGSRLTRAKHELIRVINELPEEDEFGIMFFECQVRYWKRHLLKATEKNKKEAIRFISNLGSGGNTNTYGALRGSLDFDDDLEAVFFLSDGIPTTGRITSPGLIVKDIVLKNRLRYLKINTIGIGVTYPTRTFLKTLAESCGGEYSEVNNR